MEEAKTSTGTTQHNNSSRNNKQNQPKRNRSQFNEKSHELRKRPAAKPHRRKCDIYVSNKSNFKVLIFVIRKQESLHCDSCALCICFSASHSKIYC